MYGEDERVGSWVCERTGGQFEPSCSRTIGQEANGELVAGIVYDHYNGRSIAMHVAGEGGHWLNRSLLRAVFAYPFDELKVIKVLGLVDSENVAARKLDEHLGFEVEAVIKDAAPKGDLLIYGMRRNMCRFLNGR